MATITPASAASRAMSDTCGATGSGLGCANSTIWTRPSGRLRPFEVSCSSSVATVLARSLACFGSSASTWIVRIRVTSLAVARVAAARSSGLQVEAELLDRGREDFAGR